MKKRSNSKSGFTLMEVAIAVSVVVIGVLALFALIGTGLDMSSKAIADTHAGMFANNVFGALRSISLQRSETGEEFAWEHFWEDFQAGATNITVAAPDVFLGATITIQNPNPRIPPITLNVPLSIVGNDVGDQDIHTVVYRNIPEHDDQVTNIVNIALRYRCEVDSLFPLNETVPWTNRAMVILRVWEGEFGSSENEDALVFYSEFDNPGDL